MGLTGRTDFFFFLNKNAVHRPKVSLRSKSFHGTSFRKFAFLSLSSKDPSPLGLGQNTVNFCIQKINTGFWVSAPPLAQVLLFLGEGNYRIPFEA